MLVLAWRQDDVTSLSCPEAGAHGHHTTEAMNSRETALCQLHTPHWDGSERGQTSGWYGAKFWWTMLTEWLTDRGQWFDEDASCEIRIRTWMNGWRVLGSRVAVLSLQPTGLGPEELMTDWKLGVLAGLPIRDRITSLLDKLMDTTHVNKINIKINSKVISTNIFKTKNHYSKPYSVLCQMSDSCSY